ncbi:MAG: alpha/beta hydrolase [Acidobacteria bacterium]|nr:alpha/beta hydrolase [Acidobacteriota bacterium]
MKNNLGKVGCVATCLLCLANFAFAQQSVITLYPGVAPGSENAKQKEVEFTNADKQRRIRNVTQPTLTAFLPERGKANGTAIIIAPGGGFMHLAIEKEGNAVARWLQARGVAAFVLKYRLLDSGTEEEYRAQAAAMARATAPQPKAPAPVAAPPAPNPARQKAVEFAIADGRQAIKLVRQRAAEWGIAPDRIGLMGFSAGGILAMGVVMQHDAESRPNFAAPIYGGSTSGLPVAADAPPLFIAVADDDQTFSGSSAKLYLEWKAAKRPAELHIYSKGGHGFGLTNRGWPVDSWIDRFGDWLKTQGLLK